MTSDAASVALMKNQVKEHLRNEKVPAVKLLCQRSCELCPNDAEVRPLLGGTSMASLKTPRRPAVAPLPASPNSLPRTAISVMPSSTKEKTKRHWTAFAVLNSSIRGRSRHGTFDRQDQYEQAYARFLPLPDAGERTDAVLAFTNLCRHVRRCDDASPGWSASCSTGAPCPCSP